MPVKLSLLSSRLMADYLRLFLLCIQAFPLIEFLQPTEGSRTDMYVVPSVASNLKTAVPLPCVFAHCLLLKCDQPKPDRCQATTPTSVAPQTG